MIQLNEATKIYRNIKAVDNLTLQVRKGEVFGFLGPNGAGKTTTIKMIAGLIRPVKGNIRIAGIDMLKNPIEAKALMGFIPDRPFVYEKLTGMEFLLFIGGLYKMQGAGLNQKAAEMIDLFSLREFQNELIENYSHGMRQRLVMGAAFLHSPEVIIVDEPMVGLDPQGARLVKTIFREQCSRGKTIFMSTHTLEVAEEVCDRIGIIHKGRLVALGTKDQLQQQVEKNSRETKKLESIFLQLTGGENMHQIIESLKK